MKKLPFLYHLFLLLVLATPMLAQDTSILPARKVSLVMEVAAENPPEIIAAISADPDRSLEEVWFNKKVIVNLFRLTHLAKVHVKLGTTPGATDHGQAVWSLADGIASGNLVISGKTLFLDLGQVQGYPSIHVEVILEDETGQLSDPQYFIPVTN
ncbi:MAG: hypothetical protein AAFW73_23055 [Bacteroidota bacterium]